MTSTAKDNQLDFNVLFVIALPVLIGVWEWLAFPASGGIRSARTHPNRWRTQRRRQKERRMVVDRDYVVVVLFSRVSEPLSCTRGTVSGGGEARTRSNSRRCRQGRNGRYPGHRFVVAQQQRGPSCSGDRPAMEVHLPLPNFAVSSRHSSSFPMTPDRVQRDLARRHPQFLGLPTRSEGRREPLREQRRLHQDRTAR